jgi:DNA-directed RNA polymerase subunit RPC12/RpoP
MDLEIANWEDVSKEYGECPECGSPLLYIDTKGNFPLIGKKSIGYSNYLCSKCHKIWRAIYKPN